MTLLTPLLGLPREELVKELARTFPHASAGPGRGVVPVAGHGGGRTAAIARLAAIDPTAYARSRNHVDGAVTGLSPWIRHGVLSLAEVRDAALDRTGAADQASKLISELGWREYWQRVYWVLGDAIREDIEPPAARWRQAPANSVPDDVLEARTGMACIDAFVRRLHGTGWLHNHERMWLASWLVHCRGVSWQAGADWFLEHLIDGDPASNHLSWQWVAGTFSAKPYLFNRENLESFTSGIHCRDCPVQGRCDVEGTYDSLVERLFDATEQASARPALRIRPAIAPPVAAVAPAIRPLVWLTLDSASPTSPAAARYPAAPRIFVIDPAWLAEERPAIKRLLFLIECLREVPGVEVVVGVPSTVVERRATELNCDGIAVAETPCPRTRRALAAVATALPVETVPWPRFCDQSTVRDLGRFSRWWQQVARSALTPTAA